MGLCCDGDRVFRVIDTTRHLGLPIKIACVVIPLITALTVTFSLYFLPLGAAIPFMIISICIGALGVASSYFGRPVMSISYMVLAVLIEIPVLVIIGFVIYQISNYDFCEKCGISLYMQVYRWTITTTTVCTFSSYTLLLCSQGLSMLWAALIVALISLGCTAVVISAFRKLRLFQMGITNTVIERGHGDKVTHVRGGEGGLDTGRAVGAAVAMERINQLDPEIVTNEPRPRQAPVQQDQPSPVQLAPRALQQQQQYSQVPSPTGLPTGAVPTAGGYFIPYPPTGGIATGGVGQQVIQGGAQPPAYQVQRGVGYPASETSSQYQMTQESTVHQAHMTIEQSSSMAPHGQQTGHQYVEPPVSATEQHQQPSVAPVTTEMQKQAIRNDFLSVNLQRYDEPPVEAKVIPPEHSHSHGVSSQQYQASVVRSSHHAWHSQHAVVDSSDNESEPAEHSERSTEQRLVTSHEEKTTLGVSHVATTTAHFSEATVETTRGSYDPYKDEEDEDAQMASEASESRESFSYQHSSSHNVETGHHASFAVYHSHLSPELYSEPPVETTNSGYNPYGDRDGDASNEADEQETPAEVIKAASEAVEHYSSSAISSEETTQKTSFAVSELPVETANSGYDPYKDGDSGKEDTAAVAPVYSGVDGYSAYDPYKEEVDQLKTTSQTVEYHSSSSARNLETTQKTSFAVSRISTDTHLSSGLYCEPPIEVISYRRSGYEDDSDYE